MNLKVIRGAFAALALLAVTSAASPAATNLVPFQVSVKTPQVGAFAIPGAPLRLSVQQTSAGQADLLGAFTWVDRHTGLVGYDGTPKAVTGESAFTTNNGDVLHLTWIGLIRTTGPGVTEDAFFITGGTGRFAGATGSGVLTTALDPAKKEFTYTYDGMMSAPNP
jgi:hypothetical protein